jgi:hypothetical protein
MMEAVRTSETSADNHFTRQYNPEDNSECHEAALETEMCHSNQHDKEAKQHFLPKRISVREFVVGGWMGHRACLNTEARAKILCLFQASSPYRLFSAAAASLQWIEYVALRLAMVSRCRCFTRKLR